MNRLLHLALEPLAMFMRLCAAYPLIAILVSAAAGGVAFLFGQLNGMAVLLAFSAATLCWWDEHEHPLASPVIAEA
jgi:hypothetical protein